MHKTLRQPLRLATISIAVSAHLLGASGHLYAQTASSGSVRPGEPVTLNFTNAEIEAVARTMATITGRNVVVDPRVKGTMSLLSERAVSPAAAFDQFLAALRLQGFTVVEASGLYKVVPKPMPSCRAARSAPAAATPPAAAAPTQARATAS